MKRRVRLAGAQALMKRRVRPAGAQALMNDAWAPLERTRS